MNILQYVSANAKHVGIGDEGEPVRRIQSALLAAGALVEVDGEFGTITEGAVRRFQAAHGLNVVGYVGPKTAALLDDINIPVPVSTAPSILKVAPWLSRMRSITGTKEVPGSKNSPIIMSWRNDIAKAFPSLAKYAATYTGDEIPWCGFGEGWCMAVSDIAPPDGFMYALNWAKWGRLLKEPIVGCIMVFVRAGGGHVSTLERMDGDYAYIRGCNQSDMVNVARKSMSTFHAAVWPLGYAIPAKEIEGDVSNAVHSGTEV